MKTNTLPLRLRNGAIAASPDTIVVGASLDVTSARQFARAISRMAQARPSHVIIDMSKTRTVDSSGFGALVAGLRKLAEFDAAPLVVCPHPAVRRLIDFAGVARMITLVDQLSEAHRAIAQATADALAS